MPVGRVSRGALLVVLSLPFLLTHGRYQQVAALPGGVDVHAYDLAVLTLVIAAAFAARERWPAIWPAGRAVLVAVAAWVLWIGVGLAVPALAGRDYDLGTRAVSAAGYAELALLAVAVPLLLRRRSDVLALAVGLVVWCGVAALGGLIQFLGVDVLDASPFGRRQPSIVGYHDFAALGGTTAAVGFAVAALRPAGLPAGFGPAAIGIGLAALALSGSVAGIAGMAAAVAAVLLVAGRRGTLTRRRAAGLAAAFAVAATATVAIRGGDIDQFARYLGLREQEEATRTAVQTYSQRTLLGYLGIRVFRDHPVVGVGWQATNDFATLEPYLSDARGRFDDVAAEAFPSPARPWGVQNAWIQALADLGIVGFVLFALALGVPAVVGLLHGLRAPPTESAIGLAAAAMLLVLAGIWTAQGLVAGLPADSLTWIAAALAIVASARRRLHRAD